MDFEEFKRIFNEEGILDDRVIQEKWTISSVFMNAADLEEEMLRFSIRTYVRPQPN